LKKKVFSFINITGLAIGIAFTLLIGSYVWQEVQVNSQLRNIDNQYIVLSKWKDPNMGPELNSIAELSRELKYEYPALVVNYYNSDPSYTIVFKRFLRIDYDCGSVGLRPGCSYPKYLAEWLCLSSQCDTVAICYFHCIFDGHDKFANCAADDKRGIIKSNQEHKNE